MWKTKDFKKSFVRSGCLLFVQGGSVVIAICLIWHIRYHTSDTCSLKVLKKRSLIRICVCTSWFSRAETGQGHKSTYHSHPSMGTTFEQYMSLLRWSWKFFCLSSRAVLILLKWFLYRCFRSLDTSSLFVNRCLPYWYVHFMDKENEREKGKQAPNYLFEDYVLVLKIVLCFPFDIEHLALWRPSLQNVW